MSWIHALINSAKTRFFTKGDGKVYSKAEGQDPVQLGDSVGMLYKKTGALTYVDPTTGSETGVGSPSEEQIAQAVADYLAANPVEAFPIGSLYTTIAQDQYDDPADPADLLGYGVWTPYAEGRVLVGYDAEDADFDEVGATGGAKTKNLGHTHDLGNHTHSVTSNVAVANHANHVHSGPAAHANHTHSVTSNVTVNDHDSHTHTYTQVPNHVHVQTVMSSGSGSSSGAVRDTSSSSPVADSQSTANPTGGVATATTNGPSATLTHTVNNPAVTSGNESASLSHGETGNETSTLTHSVTNNAVTSGTPSTNTSGSGGSASQDVMNPYQVVYIWLRTE